jgi:hypothetical protein
LSYSSQANHPAQGASLRSSGLPGRQQRSLDDLRGIRSMGQRQEPQRGQQIDETEM